MTAWLAGAPNGITLLFFAAAIVLAAALFDRKDDHP